MGCMNLTVTPVDGASLAVQPVAGASLAVTPQEGATLKVTPQDDGMTLKVTPQDDGMTLKVTPQGGCTLTIGEVCGVSEGTIVVLAASDGPLRTRDGGYLLLNPATNPPEN